MAGNGDSSDLHGDEVDRSISEEEYKALLEPEYYDMSQQRKMVIFNHFQYNSPYPDLKKPPSSRPGTDRDVKALLNTGKNLNFDVKVHDDKTHDEIISIIDNLCALEHRATSCVCVCILTHGGRGGALCARDRLYNLADIVSKLQDHAPGLVGKPKLLVVQACRGGLLDAGAARLDGPRAAPLLPAHVDTLLLRSSVEDYKSFRNGHGSWLIQDLCRVLDAKHRQLDLMQMLVIATKLVALDRISKSKKRPELCRKKQTPELRSTLIKTLHFSDPLGF